MLKIKTYLAPSSIDGIGLFASEDIKQGTEIWKWDYIYDVSIFYLPEDENQKDFIIKYSFRGIRKNSTTGQIEWDGIYYLCIDNAKFMNHSDSPNVISIADISSCDIASRDIKKDEEITCDYRSFDFGFKGF